MKIASKTSYGRAGNALTRQNTQKEQIFGVADDAFVSEVPEEHWRSFLKLRSYFLQLVNLLLVQNPPLQSGPGLLLNNRFKKILRSAYDDDLWKFDELNVMSTSQRLTVNLPIELYRCELDESLLASC